VNKQRLVGPHPSSFRTPKPYFEICGGRQTERPSRARPSCSRSQEGRPSRNNYGKYGGIRRVVLCFCEARCAHHIGELWVLYSEQYFHSVLSSSRSSFLVLVPGFDRYDYDIWIPYLRKNIKRLKHIIMVDGEDRHSSHCIHDEDLISTGGTYLPDVDAIEKTLDPMISSTFNSQADQAGTPKHQP